MSKHKGKKEDVVVEEVQPVALEPATTATPEPPKPQEVAPPEEKPGWDPRRHHQDQGQRRPNDVRHAGRRRTGKGPGGNPGL